MCGKFVQMLSWAELHALLRALEAEPAPAPEPGTNDHAETCTPMRTASVVCRTDAGTRAVARMRWGWPERWGAAPALDRPKHMHAKGETVDRLRSFAPAFHAGRRGIIPVRSFNIGQEVGTRVVQHVVTPRAGGPRGIAAIFDDVPTRDGGMVTAFVMVTRPPLAPLDTLTDRMPAILPPESWAAWLGEAPAAPEALKASLLAYDGALDMRPQAPPARGAGQGRLLPSCRLLPP